MLTLLRTNLNNQIVWHVETVALRALFTANGGGGT